jgi:hypothetical protein
MSNEGNETKNVDIEQPREIKTRGRPRKYATKEESHQVKLQQTKESNRRMAEKRRAFDACKPDDQRFLENLLDVMILDEDHATAVFILVKQLVANYEPDKNFSVFKLIIPPKINQ